MTTKHLSLASYIRILTAGAVKPKGTFGAMSELLFMSLCDGNSFDFSYENSRGETVIYTEDNYGKIHRGDCAVPNEIVKMAERKPREKLLQYFCNMVSSNIEGRKKKQVVLALRDTILNDPKITDDTFIGIEPAFTKLELPTIVSFTLSSFLLDIFLFSLAKTDNTVEKNFVKSINGPKFLEQFNDRIGEINLLKEQPKVINSSKEDSSKRRIVQIRPPYRPQKSENRYVEALLEIYNEAENLKTIELDNLQNYPKHEDHFKKARRDFYAAESLREGTKDLYLEDEKTEFEALEDDIFDVVSYVHDRQYPNGLTRCNEVLIAAGLVPAQSSRTMIENGWLSARQKQGICHIFVNDGLLTGWIDSDD